MSIWTVLLSALFFIILGTAFCKGWDYVKKTMPEHLVHYYMFSAVIRFLLVAAAVLAHIRFSTDTKGEKITFVLMFFAMYAVMMVITLRLKHK